MSTGSSREVDELVKALGVDAGISKSEVWRICATIHEALESSRTRLLDTDGYDDSPSIQHAVPMVVAQV